MILRLTVLQAINKIYMCSLISSAIQSLPVEQSLVAAPQPCFEASEVIVMSTSPNIGLDADSIESIQLQGPLIFVSKFKFL